jgi:glycerophosphoryl diester phosphodiesterase
VTPRLYAHRGAALERPENTMISFERALEVGAFALETDVHMSRDGVIVIAHDPDGARMAGDARFIRDLTLDELRRWDLGKGFVDAQGARPYAGKGVGIATFEELLLRFPTTQVNVDLKQRTPSMVPAMLALLEKHRATERVLLASFSTSTLREVRAAGFAGHTALGRREVIALRTLPPQALRRMRFLQRARAQLPTHQGPVRFDEEHFLEKCHALGVAVDFWTINDVATAKALLARGADGIMSDDPRVLAALL